MRDVMLSGVVGFAVMLAILLLLGGAGCTLVIGPREPCYSVVTVNAPTAKAVVFNGCTGNIELRPIPLPEKSESKPPAEF